MSISAASFLSQAVKLLLLRGGYDTIEAVASASPVQLIAHCTGIPAHEAAHAVERCTEVSRGGSCGDSGVGIGNLSITAHDLLLLEAGAANAATFGAPDEALGHDSCQGLGASTSTVGLGDHLATFVAELDTLLGGGVALGSLLEVCGAPGAGKTQFSMQLLASVQLSPLLGGASGRALFVDTEGSYVKARFEQIAQAAVDQVAAVLRVADPAAVRGVHAPTVEELLRGVDYVRLHELVDVVALIHSLPIILADSFAEGQHPIRLVIIDSIAFHFRYGFSDYSQRSRLLFGVAEALQEAARRFNVCVVVTNQLTTVTGGGRNEAHRRGTAVSHAAGGGDDDDGAHVLVPALGDAWAHAVPTRLVLRRDGSSATTTTSGSCGGAGGRTADDDDDDDDDDDHLQLQLQHISRRTATLIKSPRYPRATCRFLVCGQGIRSVPDDRGLRPCQGEMVVFADTTGDAPELVAKSCRRDV